MNKLPTPPDEIFVVIDEDGQPCFSSFHADDCHEHINAAIDWGMADVAKHWIVRSYRINGKEVPA